MYVYMYVCNRKIYISIPFFKNNMKKHVKVPFACPCYNNKCIYQMYHENFLHQSFITIDNLCIFPTNLFATFSIMLI
jgi:hypothetical protein